MTETAPTMNGGPGTGKFIDSINPDDPEYVRQLRRPAEVKEDLRQMDDRQRVKLVLNSEQFREELERVVEEQMKSGTHPASLIALQQLSELLLPGNRIAYGGNSTKTASPVIPINDLRGVESMGYSKTEKIVRCKLAALYRLVDLNGWTHGIYNHISARLGQDQEHFLINPFGILYSEVTAATLVKVDMQGDVLDPGSTMLGINRAGYTIHSAIHQARPDIKCVIHLHTTAAVTVSLMKCGLLPLSQESLICGNTSYHEYNGILVDSEDRDTLARNLGPSNKIMFLRNHGVVACGATIEEAYHYAFNVMAACETQVQAMSAGIDNLIQVDSETRKKTFEMGRQGGGGVDMTGRKWKTGELEFEALMRNLDNAGFRTGYIYHHPIVKQEKKERLNSDVEIPPASSSFTYVFDGDYEHSKFVSPLKTALDRQKKAGRAEWLVNSPNTYSKEEIEETGTQHPKKITKWVADGDSPKRSSTQIKCDDPNMFAPQGADPKELKLKQKQIKKDYYDGTISAGPQSKLLEGITLEEAQKLADGNLSGANDNVIVIGSASKGIIQKPYQHNAVVYRSAYQANPFENMTESEIEDYKLQLGKKETGETTETEPEESLPTDKGDASSSVQRSQSSIEPAKRPELVGELKSLQRSKSDRVQDFEKPSSPSKSDTLRSTDSASGGDTLDDRSSKESSPTKEVPSPMKDKSKKKKKFRMPSFSKKKSKESSI